MKKLNVVEIFADSQMFKGDDERLYHYQKMQDKVRAYQREKSSFYEEKHFEDDDRAESRHWVIKNGVLRFKSEKDSEMVAMQILSEHAEHLVFGEYALCCKNVTCSGPDGVRNYEQNYAVLRANNKDGYTDVTTDFAPGSYVISEVREASQGRARLRVKSPYSDRGEWKDLNYDAQSKTETKEVVVWSPVSNLSRQSELLLLRTLKKGKVND